MAEKCDGRKMSDVFRANKPWSVAEDEQLLTLMAEAKTARAIAACFKRTTRAVRRRAERLKLSWREAKKSGEVGTCETIVDANEGCQLKPLNALVCESTL